MGMKISEALLYVFREAGAAGGIHHTKLQGYINQLLQAGHLNWEMRGKTGEQEVHFLITEKGEQYLKRAGL